MIKWLLCVPSTQVDSIAAWQSRAQQCQQHLWRILSKKKKKEPTVIKWNKKKKEEMGEVLLTVAMVMETSALKFRSDIIAGYSDEGALTMIIEQMYVTNIKSSLH